jgi:probable HAF family extracellular repeat protein
LIRSNALFVTVGLLVAVGNAYAGPTDRYTYVDLGSGAAYGINNLNQVSGVSAKTNTATIWSKGQTTNLGTLGGSYSYALSINNNGQAVGYSGTQNDVAAHAALWDRGTVTDLGTLGGTHSVAYGINDSAQIVGWAYNGMQANHAALWMSGQIKDLDPLWVGSGSNANAINNQGQIVGAFRNWSMTNLTATTWSNGMVSFFPGINSIANSINDDGQIVGSIANQVTRQSQAVIWDNGTTGVLPTLDDFIGGAAADINRDGMIVGYSVSTDFVTRGTLWMEGKAINLQDYLGADAKNSGWELINATAINDLGSITGSVYNSKTGEYHAYLLYTEVPEPDTRMLFIGALAMLLVCRTRSKRGNNSVQR